MVNFYLKRLKSSNRIIGTERTIKAIFNPTDAPFAKRTITAVIFCKKSNTPRAGVPKCDSLAASSTLYRPSSGEKRVYVRSASKGLLTEKCKLYIILSSTKNLHVSHADSLVVFEQEKTRGLSEERIVAARRVADLFEDVEVDYIVSSSCREQLRD